MLKIYVYSWLMTWLIIALLGGGVGYLCGRFAVETTRALWIGLFLGAVFGPLLNPVIRRHMFGK